MNKGASDALAPYILWVKLRCETKLSDMLPGFSGNKQWDKLIQLEERALTLANTNLIQPAFNKAPVILENARLQAVENAFQDTQGKTLNPIEMRMAERFLGVREQLVRNLDRLDMQWWKSFQRQFNNAELYQMMIEFHEVLEQTLEFNVIPRYNDGRTTILKLKTLVSFVLLLNNIESKKKITYLPRLTQMDLYDWMKLCCLNGADKLLMSRRRSPLLFNCFDHYHYSETHQIDANINSMKIIRRPNILFSFPLLIIKAITFQINLISTLFTIPIWISYYTTMFIISPTQTLSIMKQNFKNRLITTMYYLCDVTTGTTSSSVSTSTGRINNGGRGMIRDVGLRIGWALFSAVYVGFVLVALLVVGFLIGSLIVRCLVQGPIELGKHSLRFDYTQVSPSAVVPIVSPAAAAAVRYRSSDDDGICLSNNVPDNHKLRLIVSLVLPESEFNMNLGVFQVRVEFISRNGSITGSSSHPCMMKYKSGMIHLTQTLLKMVPILVGFESESQLLTIPFKDFTSETQLKPSHFLKVVLLQRPQFLLPGAGIPHIYTADIAVETELPPFKRWLWSWRRTIYVWISLVLFFMELAYVMLFFRALLIPGRLRTKLRLLSFRRNSIQMYFCRVVRIIDILLEHRVVDTSCRPFRFENKWMIREEFVTCVQEWWGSQVPSSSASSKLFMNLKNLHKLLKSWYVGERAMFYAKVEDLCTKINVRDEVEEVRDFLVKEVRDLLVKEQILWEISVFVKLDIEKAYYRVNWEFLFDVMGRIGIREKWIDWIKLCVSTAKFSIIVNRSPKGFFESSRGIRQGDPLSPFLFVNVMEAFLRMLAFAENTSLIKGVDCGMRRSPFVICHLSFVISFYERYLIHDSSHSLKFQASSGYSLVVWSIFWIAS
ncbi:uncharacterized protein LOC124946302 [Impatiens glandulifera]|uniref:uncharacterized protein LOC124946302 n=1 Tax=Impatiens glandulifera TaxID=253017 RepID=UPI001FB14575|nr:uncharacterized protein LOC124946302 [Impatiens glandulifera]